MSRTAQPLEPPDVLDAQAWRRLAALDPEGRLQLLPRLMLTYRESLHSQAQQCRSAVAALDRQALKLATHTLKSASANVGALALAACCAQGEQLAPHGPEGVLIAWLEAWEREAGRVARAIDDWTARLPR